MAFLGPIDLSQVEISNRDPIPEGFYTAVIKNTDVVDTKDKTGKFIYLEAEVSDGPHAGTVIVDRLNVINKNEKAQNIGLGSLKRLCEAINIEFKQDTQELENTPLKIKVSIKPAEPYTNKNTGEVKPGFPSNEVKGYYPYNYNESQVAVPPVVQQPQNQENGPFKQRG
jgi:hypothetical protein